MHCPCMCVYSFIYLLIYIFYYTKKSLSFVGDSIFHSRLRLSRGDGLRVGVVGVPGDSCE